MVAEMMTVPRSKFLGLPCPVIKTVGEDLLPGLKMTNNKKSIVFVIVELNLVNISNS